MYNIAKFIHYFNALSVDLRFRAWAAFQSTYCMRMGFMYITTLPVLSNSRLSIHYLYKVNYLKRVNGKKTASTARAFESIFSNEVKQFKNKKTFIRPWQANLFPRINDPFAAYKFVGHEYFSANKVINSRSSESVSTHRFDIWRRRLLLLKVALCQLWDEPARATSNIVLTPVCSWIVNAPGCGCEPCGQLICIRFHLVTTLSETPLLLLVVASCYMPIAFLIFSNRTCST